ncbi:MAG: hypothetical protein K6F52_08225 [Clostridia bacterium]|nr:hypothetical protein [Clostridia bacterium]
MKIYKAAHMIKMEDLNHHSNLYAGRAIEWMMESSFIAACLSYGNKRGLLYKNTHQFDFTKSAYPGEIITYCSSVVRFGRTSLTMRVAVISEETGELKAEGYTTFVTVDPDTQKPCAHGMKLDETTDPEELSWRKKAESFFSGK